MALILLSLAVLFAFGLMVESFTQQTLANARRSGIQPAVYSSLRLRKLWARDKASATASSASDSIINGEEEEGDLFSKLQNVELTKEDVLPEAPHLSYDKYLTMQDKRVPVTIRYSGGAGLKPYFLTVAKKLKMSHPDVVLERLILPAVDESGDMEATFEVLVDRKVVVGNGRLRKQQIGNGDMAHGRSVFVSMQELDLAISRARRRRRPSTLYGDFDQEQPGVGLQTLRKSKEQVGGMD